MDERPSWTVRVIGREGGGVDVFARAQRLRIGAAFSFDDEYPELTAIDCVLGALGGDLVSGLLHAARRRGVPIDHAEARVTGDLGNALVALGVAGETGDAGLRGLRVDVFVSSPASDSAVRGLWDDAFERSPLGQTFRVLPGFDVRLTVTP